MFWRLPKNDGISLCFRRFSGTPLNKQIIVTLTYHSGFYSISFRIWKREVESYERKWLLKTTWKVKTLETSITWEHEKKTVEAKSKIYTHV